MSTLEDKLVLVLAEILKLRADIQAALAVTYTQGIADARKAVETARTPFFPGCPEAEGVSAMRNAALAAIDAIKLKETSR